MSETADLPPPSLPLHALGSLATVLEQRLPGLLDEWVEALEQDALNREVVRLRGPREEPAVAVVRAGALTWTRHVRLITLAMIGARKQRKRG